MKKKLQDVITQQRINLAEVNYLNLEPIERLLKKNRNVKDHFMQNKNNVQS